MLSRCYVNYSSAKQLMKLLPLLVASTRCSNGQGSIPNMGYHFSLSLSLFSIPASLLMGSFPLQTIVNTQQHFHKACTKGYEAVSHSAACMSILGCGYARNQILFNNSELLQSLSDTESCDTIAFVMAFSSIFAILGWLQPWALGFLSRMQIDLSDSTSHNYNQSCIQKSTCMHMHKAEPVRTYFIKKLTGGHHHSRRALENPYQSQQ